MGTVPPSGQPEPLQPGEFTPSEPANVVTFKTTDIELPSALYIQRDDQIDVKGLSTLGGGDTITFSYRFLLPNGVIIPGQIVLAIQSGIMKESTITLGEGFLLSLTAIAQTAVQRGQSYVQASISRPSAAPASQMQVLFADYVTSKYTAGWPNGRSISATEGPGAIVTVTHANPAAGADFAIAITSGIIAKIRSITMTFTTSAAVANRVPRWQIKDAVGNIVAVCEPNQVVPASQTVFVTLSTVVPNAAANVPDVVVALPTDEWLLPGYNVVTSTTNIQAADQYTTIFAEFEEWVQF